MDNGEKGRGKFTAEVAENAERNRGMTMENVGSSTCSTIVGVVSTLVLG